MVTELAVLNRLNLQIKKSGVKKAWLAKQIGIHPVTFRRKINGEATFTIGEIVGIINAMRLTDREAYYIFFDSEFQN